MMERKVRHLLGAYAALAMLLPGLNLGGQEQKPRPPYPKPQIEKLEAAPDFTLQDQDGLSFKLSEQRRPILLYFYRGYW